MTTSNGSEQSCSQGTGTYRVVVNDEQQYSIWPEDRSLPAGWNAEGFAGTSDACLTYIGKIWTDMRPRSLR